MIIGVDVDEVLADFMKSFINFHNQKYKTSYKREDFYNYYFWEIMEIPLSEAVKRVYEFYNHETFGHVEPVFGSVKAIEILSKEHDLIVVTSRPSKIKERTLNWLEKHFPGKFKKVVFGNHYAWEREKKKKSDICLEADVKLLIEDHLPCAKECAEKGIKVILISCPWNQTSEDLHESIVRVKDWSEVLEIIKKLES